MMRNSMLVLVLAACGGGAPTPPVQAPTEPVAPAPQEPAPAPVAPIAAPQGTLYERLGGLPAIEAVMNELVNRTTTDPRIKERFFNTDAANLKKLLAELVCQVAGGPCKYTGRDMESSHAGMELVDEEFTALVENLVAALDKFEVPEREKSEILGAIGPLKPQIVVAPGKLRPIEADSLAKVSELASKLATVAAELSPAGLAGQRARSYAEQLFRGPSLRSGASRCKSSPARSGPADPRSSRPS